MASTKTRCVIWARAGGRCHFPGCNKSLIGDLIANNEDANFGFIAHIVAETPGGPRGDPILSPLLEDDANNLMLLCGPHLKLVDVDEKDAYPVQRFTRHQSSSRRPYPDCDRYHRRPCLSRSQIRREDRGARLASVILAGPSGYDPGPLSR